MSGGFAGGYLSVALPPGTNENVEEGEVKYPGLPSSNKFARSRAGGGVSSVWNCVVNFSGFPPQKGIDEIAYEAKCSLNQFLFRNILKKVF